jgi:hypothetical protein
MKWKTKLDIILIITLLTLFIPLIHSNVSNETFTVFLESPSSIGFQNDIDTYLIVTMQTGNMSSNSSTIALEIDHGYFSILPNQTGTFTVTFTSNIPEAFVNNVRFETGDTGNFTIGTTTIIEWWIPYETLLPIMFIVGMIGLASIFYGMWKSISSFQQKEYLNAGIYAITFIALGSGLFLAWVFA